MDAEIKKIVDAAVANTEANCGVKYTQFGDGFTRAELPLKPEHMNFMGIIFGGLMYNLADLTAGVAFLTKGGFGPTVSGDMQFINNAANISVLICEANVVKYGQRLCFIKADLMDENRRLLAQGNYVFCNVPKSGFIEKISQ